jgi:hypothetical protein
MLGRARTERNDKHGEGRNRTGDTTVFSRVLYQLSYLASSVECTGAFADPRRRLRPAAGAGLGPAGGDTTGARCQSKEGARGGTMGSPAVDTTVFSRVLYQLSYLASRASVAAS